MIHADSVASWEAESSALRARIVTAQNETDLFKRRLATSEECRNNLFAVIQKLQAALQDAVANCCECGGTGNTYTMADETQIGQAPGSSRIDCPLCSKMRAALR